MAGGEDFSRIQQCTDDQVGDIEPFVDADPDPVVGGRPAYMFHNFPNSTAALSNVCQWFMSRRYYDANSNVIRSTGRYRCGEQCVPWYVDVIQ